jgi:hypothetical protein
VRCGSGERTALCVCLGFLRRSLQYRRGVEREGKDEGKGVGMRGASMHVRRVSELVSLSLSMRWDDMSN